MLCGYFSAATNVPTPGVRVTSPSARSRSSASRTVLRETPKSVARSASAGSAPSASSPCRTWRRSTSATCRARSARCLNLTHALNHSDLLD